MEEEYNYYPLTEKVIQDTKEPQYNTPSEFLDPSNIIPSPNGTIMKGGSMQSPNFSKGNSGWQIDAEGNAEFNDGTFRGTFNLGGTVITINNTQDIQTFLDTISTAGGGTLFLEDGTYTLTADVSVPAGVTLQGNTRDGVILDCDASYKVKIIGSGAYSTGTISINNGDTTVVGSGTTFTSGMVGQHILLNDFYYEITAFTDTTHITISPSYSGNNLSGDTYVIATVNRNAVLRKFTITGATAEGLKIQYGFEPWIDDLIIYGNGTGINADDTVYLKVFCAADENGVNLDFSNVHGFKIDYCSASFSTTGHGVVMNDCSNSTFFDTAANGNTTDGINLTNCSTIYFASVSIDGNGGQGIELVSGCNDNQFVGVNPSNNTSDGFKITATSDRNTITACSVLSNGGWGINIAASTCDGNVINSPTYSGNSSGTLTDSGTGTVIISTTLTPVYKNGRQDYETSTASGTVNIAHGCGGIPKFIEVWAYHDELTEYDTRSFAHTWYNGTTQTSFSLYFNTGTLTKIDEFRTNGDDGTGGDDYASFAFTFDATNIICTITKVGNPNKRVDLRWRANT